MISLFANKPAKLKGAGVILLLLAVVCSACTQHSTSSSPGKGSISSDNITIGAPDLLTRAIDVEALVPVLLVNETEVDVFRDAAQDSWSATYQLRGSDLSINLRWFEESSGDNLLLASWTQQLTNVDTDRQVTILESEYISRIYDIDRDGFSNLLEREMNTDPYDPDEFPGADEETLLLEPFSIFPVTRATDNPDTVALKFMHASEDAPSFAIFVEETGPLNPSMSGVDNQLRFDGDDETDTAFGLFDPGATYNVNLFPDYYTGNRSAAISIDYSPAVGSVSLVVLRGLVDADGSDPDRPTFEALTYESQGPSGPDTAKVRVVHAARGMSLVSEGCNCLSGELDLYFDSSTNLPLTSTPVRLSYQSQDTTYIEMPAGDYAFTVTETDNPTNIRFLSFLTLDGAFVTTIVLKDDPDATLGTKFKAYAFDDLSLDD